MLAWEWCRPPTRTLNWYGIASNFRVGVVDAIYYIVGAFARVLRAKDTALMTAAVLCKVTILTMGYLWLVPTALI